MLRFDENKLTSTLPDTIGNLQACEEFRVDENEMSGNIPTTIGLMKNVVELRLDGEGREDGMEGNNFQGTIPTEVGTMESLAYFYVNDNSISGTIPTELALAQDLQLLYLYNNPELTGTVPTQLASLPSLESLFLDGTNLQGEMPAEICAIRAPEDSETGLVELTADCLDEPPGTAKLKCSCCSECFEAAEQPAVVTPSTPAPGPTEPATPAINGSTVTDKELPVVSEPTSAPAPPPTIDIGAVLDSAVDEAFQDQNALNVLLNGAIQDASLNDLISNASPDSMAALSDANSPQSKALVWLSDDPNLDSYDDQRKIDRFSLASFYLSSTPEPWIDSTGWNGYGDECDYYGIECEDTRVVALNLTENNVRG